jgi:hypothetical protein
LPARERERSSYTLRATGADGTVVQRQVILEVVTGAVAAPEIVLMAYSPDKIAPGGSTVLRWEVRGATRVLVNGKEVAAKGEFVRNQMTESKYSDLVAEGPGGTRVTRRAEFAVVRPVVRKPGFRIERFEAESIVGIGGPRTELRFDAPGAKRLSIQPEVGFLTTTRGAVVVNPVRTTRYTLTATGPDGESDSRTVDVNIVERRSAPTWAVQHHNPSSGCRDGFCRGVLAAVNGRLVFTSETATDDFAVPFSEVTEVRGNKYLLGRYNGFHVKTATRNFNFVPDGPVDAVVGQINRAMGR